jgi:hypothetical protein
MNMQPVSFTYPQPSDLQQFIADQVHQRLTANGAMEIWPGTPTNVPKQIQVSTVASIITPLPDPVLAIAINSTAGSQLGQLASFVPSGKSLAIAVSAAQTMDMVTKSQSAQFPNLPATVPGATVNGHPVRLNSLTPSLTNAIHYSGEVTAVNVILGSIDVDAGFDVDVGLHWGPQVPSTQDPSILVQNLVSDVGNPDVHISGLGWLLVILGGLITGDILVVIITIVIQAVIQNIASSIGGSIVRNTVSNAIEGLGAWPSPLDAVGPVNSAFDTTIVISTDGLLFTG